MVDRRIGLELWTFSDKTLSFYVCVLLVFLSEGYVTSRLLIVSIFPRYQKNE